MQKNDFLDLANSLKFLWKYYIVFGIGFMVFGALALFNPEFFAVYIVSVIGWFFVFGGIGNFIYAIRGKDNPALHWGTILFLGILEIISGIIVITNPIFSLYFLTIYIGVFLLFRGFTLISAKNPGYTLIESDSSHLNGIRSLNNLNGVLDIIFGIMAMIIPLFAEQVFIYALIFYLILGGLLVLIYGAQIKSSLNHMDKK